MADKPYTIPAKYAFATEVPKAGASCATCIYSSSDGKRCENELYPSMPDTGGTNVLPKPGDRWCCALWQQ